MVRISVMYPSGEGKKFDYDYDVNKHMALVTMKPHGKELFADVPNFTDITPQMQISEIIS
jgi:hypothetical protein